MVSLRLPPEYVVVPTKAIFRENPLAPELWDTWKVLRAIAWVNNYEFTPPVSVAELVAIHRDEIGPRALFKRLARLERQGWIRVERRAGMRTVYIPTVPPDVPPDSTRLAATCAEGASMIPGVGEDSSRSMSEAESAYATPELQFTGQSGNTVVVALDRSDPGVDFQQQQQSNTRTRTREEAERLQAAFEELGIGENAWAELLALPHVTVEYVEEWVAQRRATHGRLGGGFYRTEMRLGHRSPYRVKREESERHEKRVVIADPEQAGAGEIWAAVCGEMEEQLAREAFARGLAKSHGLLLEGDRLLVGVPDGETAQWLEEHLHRALEGALVGIVGRRIAIHYEVRDGEDAGGA